MKVQDIMIKDVKFCHPETNLAEATQIMWANDCGALPVVDGEKKVVGMITDRDICIAVGTRDRTPSQVKVSEVKANPQELFTCAPSDDIHQALKTMRTYGVRRIPVVNNDALRGILCLDDVAFHASKRGDLSYEDLVETLKAVTEHRLARHMVAA
jgi:CBS domain-containing protein